MSNILSQYIKTIESGLRPAGGVNTEDGDIPSLGGENIIQEGGVKYETLKLISKEFYSNLNRGKLQEGDVLINKDGANTGKVGIYYPARFEEAAINEHLFLLRGEPKELDQFYLYYSLLSEEGQKQIFNQITGSAQPGLNANFIQKFKLSLPALPLQRKIARILSTADAVIEKTQAAIAKYKAIKQGMLHDLFIRGIDIQTCKLRPRYEDAPELYKDSSLGFIPVEWEVMQVADVSENLDGKRIPVKQENRDKQAEIYPYYGASGIIDYVEDYIFDEPLILLGEDGENVVSRNLPLAFKVEGKIWVNNHAHVLRPISGITTIEFLCEALESIDYSPIVSGSAQPKITQGHLSKILVRIPEIEEQIKISERIVSINKKLHTEQTYLHKLQQLKAGLMSDLLSGRVKVSESQMEGIKG